MVTQSPGICLTFDDLFVENWCAAREIFDHWNAKVTFCVSHLHTASDEQLRGLQDLQSDGHEIAYHSRTHPRLFPYLERHGLEHWLRHEIDQGRKEHQALGFPAQSFACPFHAYTPELLQETAKRFKVIRAAGPGHFHLSKLPGRIYSRLGADKIVHNIGFCDMQLRSFPGWENQNLILDRIAEAGGIGVFAGHDIRASFSGQGYYSVHRQIKRLLIAAKERGLAFYTLEQLAVSPCC